MRLKDGLVWSYGPPPKKLGSSWNGMAITSPSKSVTNRRATRTTHIKDFDESWYDGCRVVSINGVKV